MAWWDNYLKPGNSPLKSKLVQELLSAHGDYLEDQKSKDFLGPAYKGMTARDFGTDMSNAQIGRNQPQQSLTSNPLGFFQPQFFQPPPPAVQGDTPLQYGLSGVLNAGTRATGEYIKRLMEAGGPITGLEETGVEGTQEGLGLGAGGETPGFPIDILSQGLSSGILGAGARAIGGKTGGKIVDAGMATAAAAAQGFANPIADLSALMKIFKLFF